MLPRPGTIAVSRVQTLPTPGSLPSATVVTRRAAGSIQVERVARALPEAGSKALKSSPGVGDRELGKVAVDDRVVVKLASRAAAEIPDVGAVAPTVLGATVPGLARLGGRATSLDQLPKTEATVDGATVFITVEVSVRYPAPLAETTEAVRSAVIERVHALSGLQVAEVDVTVGALVTDVPTRARVR